MLLLHAMEQTVELVVFSFQHFVEHRPPEAIAYCWRKEAKVWLGPCVESYLEGGNSCGDSNICLVRPLLYYSTKGCGLQV